MTTESDRATVLEALQRHYCIEHSIENWCFGCNKTWPCGPFDLATIAKRALDQRDEAVELAGDLAKEFDRYVMYLHIHNNYDEDAAKVLADRPASLKGTQ